MSGFSSPLKRKVAREAAFLLYRGVEKEYKQAKLKAARIFGTSFLPSNLQVARQLDKIAEEREGAARERRLIKMRKQALDVMETLAPYHPVLVGSVWRGTIHHDSDIDLVVYHQDPQKVLETMNQKGLEVLRTDRETITREGMKKTSFHIHLKISQGEEGEVIVRSPEEVGQERVCEIYGDKISGLHLKELRELLEEEPAKRFVPF